MQTELSEALSAGAMGYFIKPVDHKTLVRTVNEITGAESRCPPS